MLVLFVFRAQGNVVMACFIISYDSVQVPHLHSPGSHFTSTPRNSIKDNLKNEISLNSEEESVYITLYSVCACVHTVVDACGKFILLVFMLLLCCSVNYSTWYSMNQLQYIGLETVAAPVCSSWHMNIHIFCPTQNSLWWQPLRWCTSAPNYPIKNINPYQPAVRMRMPFLCSRSSHWLCSDPSMIAVSPLQALPKVLAYHTVAHQ